MIADLDKALSEVGELLGCTVKLKEGDGRFLTIRMETRDEIYSQLRVLEFETRRTIGDSEHDRLVKQLSSDIYEGAAAAMRDLNVGLILAYHFRDS